MRSGTQYNYQSRLALSFGTAILALAIIVVLFSIALTVRCYMRCPFGDEWFVINSIANGQGPSSWSWIFSQHNEHRIAFPRLLIWLDVAGFHGKNISLFAEIYLVLTLHWIAICYALEHFTEFSTALKRTLEGVFGFCIFHPNQSENLTWAFQIAFVVPFAAATIALLAIAFFRQVRRPWVTALSVALAPVFAGLNLVSGLLIGPVVVCLAIVRRLPYRFVAIIAAIFSLSAAWYFWNFRSPQAPYSPQYALADPKGIFVYVLTYFGASWTNILPHKERIAALLSLVCFAGLLIRSTRRRKEASEFEWFCIAECSLMVAVAVTTALGRLAFGVGQAYASRYQTPAMLYWGALSSLVLIAVWDRHRVRFPLAQGIVLAIMFLSALTFFRIWDRALERADQLRRACEAVATGAYSKETVEMLGATAGVEPGASMLRDGWHAARKR